MRKKIVADGEKLELRFQGLAKCMKALLELDQNVRIPLFPIWPNVYFRIGKRHYILDAREYAPNMKVYLEALHDIVNVESDAKRGGA